MRSLVSCKLLRLLVLVRRQQLAKSISRGFFIARHIYRNTWRETKTFKRAVKHISHHKHLNAGSIQVMDVTATHKQKGIDMKSVCVITPCWDQAPPRSPPPLHFRIEWRSYTHFILSVVSIQTYPKIQLPYFTVGLQVGKFWISGETSLKSYGILYAFFPTSFWFHFFSHVKIHPFLE